MCKTSASQLKATIRACLAWVKAGEEVVVTESGIPIAKIVPLAAINQAVLVTRGSGSDMGHALEAARDIGVEDVTTLNEAKVERDGIIRAKLPSRFTRDRVAKSVIQECS